MLEYIKACSSTLFLFTVWKIRLGRIGTKPCTLERRHHEEMYYIPRRLHLFSLGRQDDARKLASKTHVDMVDHGIVGVAGPSHPAPISLPH